MIKYVACKDSFSFSIQYTFFLSPIVCFNICLPSSSVHELSIDEPMQQYHDLLQTVHEKLWSTSPHLSHICIRNSNISFDDENAHCIWFMMCRNTFVYKTLLILWPSSSAMRNKRFNVILSDIRFKPWHFKKQKYFEVCFYWL